MRENVLNIIEQILKWLGYIVAILIPLLTFYFTWKNKKDKDVTSAGKKNKKKDDDFFGFLPGGLGKKCVGRKSEKKIVRNNIKNEESLFIYGPAGIGKSNLVKHSILGIKRSVKKHYKRILYYDFALSSPDKDSAINDLCSQIDPNSKDFRNLVNQNKYLIWLDGCEFTDCIKELMNISYNPVYIFCSRDWEQTKDFKLMEGDEKSIIKMNVLSINNALKLLNNTLFSWLPIHDVYKKIKKIIIKFVGYHPYIIYMIRQDSLYKKSPIKFLDYLIKNGLNCSKDDGHSIIYKEEYNMEMLLKKCFGLDFSEENEVLSENTKKALGFIGCLAEEKINLVPFFDDENYDELAIFGKDVIEEIKNSSLNHFFIISNEFIQVTHWVVHKVLSENVGKFLNDDYSCLLKYVTTIGAYSLKIREKRSNSVSNMSDNYLSTQKNHLYHCLQYLILNKVDIPEDEKFFVTYDIQLLAAMGLYREALSLTDEMQKSGINLDDDAMSNIEDSRLICFDGLQMYDECLKYLLNKKSQCDSIGDELTNYHNIVDIYIRTQRFTEAKQMLSETKEFIKNNIDDQSEFSATLLSIQEIEREIIWYLQEESIDEFIENQENYRKSLLTQYDNYEADFAVIEADLLLAFAYQKVDTKKASELMGSIISRVVRKRVDPDSIDVIYRLGDFFYDLRNYNQAKEFYKLVLYLCYDYYGSEHVFTNKVRNKFNDNQEKLSSEKDNPNEILIHVNLPNEK